jgi:hypothetical protein
MNVLGAIACKADRTLLVDPIRASSLNRLRKQAGQTTAPDQRPAHHFMLATREPSTQDVRSAVAGRDGGIHAQLAAAHQPGHLLAAPLAREPRL